MSVQAFNTSFVKNLNKISPVVFALALVKHKNVNIHRPTYIFLNYSFGFKGLKGTSKQMFPMKTQNRFVLTLYFLYT